MKGIYSIFRWTLPLVMITLVVTVFSCQKQTPTTARIIEPDNYLTLEKAIDEAYSFLEEVEPTITRVDGEERRVASSWVKSLDSNARSNDSKSPKMYILNFADSLGFAIVSNDPKKGVLGLSFSGTFSENEPIENPGFAIIMERLEAAARIPMRGDSIDHYEYGQWQETYYVPITGYCQVKWYQGLGTGNQFNAYCPVIDGIRCPAGCGPLAMAMLMSMYKYPLSYGAYAFDWDSMIANSAATDNYSEYYVGRLLQQLGLSQNLNVVYGTEGSTSFNTDIPDTFENFGYANGGTVGYLYSYTAIQDLKNGYPVIITGDTASGIGHAWLAHGVYDRSRVCIGYSASGDINYYGIETNEYVLHNFGDGGFGDGFYLLDTYDSTNGPDYVDPIIPYVSYGGNDYVSNIACVYGIRCY